MSYTDASQDIHPEGGNMFSLRKLFGLKPSSNEIEIFLADMQKSSLEAATKAGQDYLDKSFTAHRPNESRGKVVSKACERTR